MKLWYTHELALGNKKSSKTNNLLDLGYTN